MWPVANPEILFVVEHVARELDVACAIRSLARRQAGVRVEVVSLYYDRDRLPTLRRPQVIVAPHFTSWKDFGIREILQALPGVPIVNLQFEQLVSPGNARIKLPRDRAALTQVLHCAMGRFFADALTAVGVPDPHVLLTGSLACQLYRPPYRRFYEGKRRELARRHGLDPSRTWVFFPENFGAAFFTPKQIEQRIRAGYDPREMHEYCEHSRRSFAEIMPWCAEGGRLGTVELIVRPRPATPCAAFVEAFQQAAGAPPRGLHFIKDHSVREWTLASNLVVSSFSTTLLESAVAQVPTWLLAPLPLPESMRSEWHRAAPQVCCAEDFLDLLSHPPDEPSRRLAGWARDHLLAHGDPIQNVVDLLVSIAKGTRPAPVVRLPRLQQAWEATTGLLRRTSRRLRTRLRPQPRGMSQYLEMDRFTQADVEQRTAAWDRIFAAKAREAA